MTMGRFLSAVDQIDAMGGWIVWLGAVVGEPLLDDKFLERALYIRRRSKIERINFVTTFQDLHRHDLGVFFEARFNYISVSTVLCGPEHYRGFFGVDRYGQMLENLLRFLEENKRRGYPVDVYVDCKSVPVKPEDILKHPDCRRVRELLSDPRKLDESVRWQPFLAHDWGGAAVVPAHWKKRPLLPRHRRPCPRLFDSLVVYTGGEIGICACQDFNADSELVLGHIDRDRLEDVWRSERLARIREDWLTGRRVPEICALCRNYRYGPVYLDGGKIAD